MILLAVADEEVGDRGMQHLLDEHWSELDCGVMINEGGIGIKDAQLKGQTIYAISVAEKGTLWLRLVASGKAGHGSPPKSDRAPSRLQRAMALLAMRSLKPRVHLSAYELLKRVGDQHGCFTALALGHRSTADLFAVPKLLALPHSRARKNKENTPRNREDG